MKALLPNLSRVATPQQIYASRYVIALVVTLATTLEVLDLTVVNVAIPAMMGNLGATLDEIAWVTTAYAIANAIVVPISSWLSDRLGQRNYFALCIGVFTLASLMCGTATSVGELIFWRIVQGLAGGGLIPGSMLILLKVFPPAEVGVGLAIWAAGLNVGPALGPLVGGWLTDNFSWPWVFYINLPLGGLTLLLALMYVPEDPQAQTQTRQRRVDVPGLLLLALAIGCAQALIERGERQGWFESTEVLIYALVALIAAPLFIWHERRIADPVIDLGIFRNRQFVSTLPLAMMVGASGFMSSLSMPVFLQTLVGHTATQASLTQLPFALGLVACFALAGKASSMPGVDMRYVILAGLLTLAGSFWLSAGLTLQASTGDVLLMLTLRGAGIALIMLPLSSLCVARLPAHQVGDGNALFNLFRQTGGAMGLAAFTSLLEVRTHVNRGEMAAQVHSLSGPAAERLAQLKQLFLQQGDSPAIAAQRALQMLDATVTQHAAMASYNQIYTLFAIAVLLMLLVLPFMVTGRVAPGAAPAH